MPFINKVPNFFIARGIKSPSHFYNFGKALKVTGVLKFSNCEPSQNCQYSTLHRSRCGKYANQYQLTVSKPTLSFVSFLSSGANEERFQVVITNPIDKTTSTSEISLKSTEVIGSSNTLVSNETITDSASDIVDIATIVPDVLPLTDIVEPSLASLGLITWSPVGIVVQCLEYFHINMHMPWWMSIVTCTVIARILLIPLLIKTQKNAVKMSNHMPQLQYLQAKFGEARRTGNPLEASKYASEIMMFMKDNKISPLKNAMFPMLQAPVFLSFFIGLRKMAKLPVESMICGGVYWTTDLTIPDPYYLMPLIASSTLYVILKVGAESGVRMDNMKMAKYFLRAIPVIAFPFMINFPSAILYYWCTNNLCTLFFVSILKIEPVRQFLKIPTRQPVDPKFTANKKSFIAGIKESYEDQKVLAAVEDRRRIDAVSFQKAGTGPIPRTYAYDPTKPRPAAAAAAGIKSQAKTFKT